VYICREERLCDYVLYKSTINVDIAVIYLHGGEALSGAEAGQWGC